MEERELLEALARTRVLPLLSGEEPERLLSAGRILLEEGFSVLEVALRTPQAPAALERAAKELPGALVGAGTVLEPGQVEEARRAGARFCVSPGFRPALVEAAREAGLLLIPGVATPTEAMAALEEGLTLLKFFPARELGGVPRLRALQAALGHRGLRWIPTGGVNLENLASYLEAPWVAACGGSWIAPRSLVEKGDRAALLELARKTRTLSRNQIP